MVWLMGRSATKIAADSFKPTVLDANQSVRILEINLIQAVHIRL